MGTLLMLIFRFVLGWNALEVADYQVISVTASLDTIALLVLLKLLKKKQA